MHEYTMLIIGNVHDENREMYSQENTSEDLVAFRCADLDDVPIGIPSVGGDRLLDNPLGPSPIPSAFPAAAMFLLVISLHKYCTKLLTQWLAYSIPLCYTISNVD